MTSKTGMPSHVNKANEELRQSSEGRDSGSLDGKSRKHVK